MPIPESGVDDVRCVKTAGPNESATALQKLLCDHHKRLIHFASADDFINSQVIDATCGALDCRSTCSSKVTLDTHPSHNRMVPLADVQGKYWAPDEIIYLLEQMCAKGNSGRGYPFAEIAVEAGSRLGRRCKVHVMLKPTGLPAIVQCAAMSIAQGALIAV